jgi:hypothetical protein
MRCGRDARCRSSFVGLVTLACREDGAPSRKPTLYALASDQQSAGAAVFNDVTTENYSFLGVTASTLDRETIKQTGLGSLDAALLNNHWSTLLLRLGRLFSRH